MTAPATPRNLNIALYTQGTEFNGNSVIEKGLGGSESALLYIARELAQLGHKLTVFCNCDQPGVYNGVDYKKHKEFLPFCEQHIQDICIFSRFYEPLPHANVAVKILWLHDIAGIKYYGNALPVIDDYISRYFLIGEWQKAGFTNHFDISEHKLFLTRNGVDLKLFQNPPPRDPNKLIYINTPFRGLDVLCKLFPQIRERIPDAELHVYAGMSLYGDQFQDTEEELHDLYNAARSQTGIHLHEPVPKAELATQLMTSCLSVYPSHFEECCSIASLEAQAAGTPMITSNLAGLKDTIVDQETGVLIPIDDSVKLSRSATYQQRFIDSVARLLEDNTERERLSLNAKRHIHDNYTWPRIAREWEAEFFTLLDEQKVALTPRVRAGEAELARIANQFFQGGNIVPALDTYKQLCQLNPANAQAWHMRSAISGMLGDFPDTAYCCEKALSLVPNAAAVYGNYANALMEMERYDDALAAFTQALNLNPDDIPSQVNLGKLYRKLGNTSKAIRHLSDALNSIPNMPEAMDELGQVHFASGNYNEALSCYKAAVSECPDSAVYQNNLGTAYQQLEDGAKAERCFLESIRLNPELLITYCNLAYIYSSQGHYDKSLDYYGHALGRHADYEPALSGRAVVLERMGKHKSAFDLIKPIIESGAYTDQTALAYARLGTRLGHEQHAVTVLKSLLSRPLLSHHDRIQANYALGGLLDRRKEYDTAFAHFRTANELRNVNFERWAQREMDDAIIHTFTPEHSKQFPISSNTEEGIVFVVGMPRSGTTLVEQILASHPDIFGAGELTDIRDIAASLPGKTGSKFCFPLEFNRVTTEILDKFSYSYTRKLHDLANGESIIVDKMPSNFMFLGLIEHLLPNARIIHCKRDPMDTCLSCYMQHFSNGQYFSYNQSDLAFFYNSYRGLMKHWKSALHLPVLEVQYEELVGNQEAVTRQIIAFTGLDWNPDCLSFYESGRKVITASYEQVRNPIYSSSVGKWKKYQKHLSVLKRGLSGQDI